MLSTKLKEAASNSADATLYVDDVFSTYLYTGNGSTQTITNGIDLAGKGGLVWTKSRSAATDHKLTDTVRGATKALISSTTAAETTDTTGLTAFNSTGFSLGASSVYNTNAATYVSWTFRKAAKFFDVVTWTGNGVNGRAISHNLGIAPGMIIVKSTSNASNWVVYHQSLSLPTNKTLRLNTTSAELTGGYFPTLPTSSVFYTNGDGYEVNTTGQTYVAYLYAHDTSSTGIIQCGSFTTNAGGNATVNLGWEPQYLMIKSSSLVDDWQVVDVLRGYCHTGWNILKPNTSNGEATNTSSNNVFYPIANGFESNGLLAGSTTYIYMAIRRPNKPPTSGVQVFSPNLSAATTGTPITTGFPLDLQIQQYTGFPDSNFLDRLRGVSSTSTVSGPYIRSTTTAAEVSPGSTTLNVNNTGFQICAGFSGASTSYLNFKRAPGFFDVVCYTGTGVARTVAHNLGVAPELMIVKCRSRPAQAWDVYAAPVFVPGTNYTVGILNDSIDFQLNNALFNYVRPTASVFSVGVDTSVNFSGDTYVAYLFATLAGISKVGSYTGNGSSQNINCGFAAGARFVLIKRTDSTGDWYVWDTARGIVAANDPHLSLNTSAAEVTTDDSVDPYSAGFTVNQVAATNINVSSATYIFLAIA